MSDDSDLERTESPSPRRLEKAREEGQVARSRELSTFAVLGSAGLAVVWLGQGLVQTLQTGVAHGLTLSRNDAFHSEAMARRLGGMATDALIATLPVIGVMAAGGIAAAMMLGGWLFSTKAVLPDFSRMNPAKGLGRIFSGEGLAELVKAIIKSVALISLSGWLVWSARDSVIALGSQNLKGALSGMVNLLTRDYFTLCAVLGVIALLDAPYQWWRHYSRLKMSRQELRDEARESDGDPHVKSRIRNLQRESARRRMMSRVPTADVIVVNPTHYAVALSYKPNMRAPQVVAKGVDLTAARIRDIAAEHRIPVLEAPPLARALYTHTDLEQDIPVALYEAVALVLAYVMQLKRARTEGGAWPDLPTVLPVPADLDPGNAADLRGSAA